MLQPMVSQLGVTSDEIPLKLEVRSGGKKEQQVVVVKNIIATSLRKEFESIQEYGQKRQRLRKSNVVTSASCRCPTNHRSAGNVGTN